MRKVDSGISAVASRNLRPSPGASAHNDPFDDEDQPEGDGEIAHCASGSN